MILKLSPVYRKYPELVSPYLDLPYLDLDRCVSRRCSDPRVNSRHMAQNTLFNVAAVSIQARFRASQHGEVAVFYNYCE
jgi:hypothetical protein